MAANSAYSLDNPVFAGFLFYGALVLLKMIAASLLVTFRRLSYNVFSNPEDCTAYGPQDADNKVKPNFNHELVERARRNHANDLENIPMFVLAALGYIAIGPSLGVAMIHFRVFTAARFLHTICYQVLQVATLRSICHVIGMGVTISMIVQVVMTTI